MFSYDEYIMCISTGLYYMSSKFNMIIQHTILKVKISIKVSSFRNAHLFSSYLDTSPV